MAHRDHFVRSLSVRPSGSHTLLVVTFFSVVTRYFSQVIRAFLGMHYAAILVVQFVVPIVNPQMHICLNFWNDNHDYWTSHLLHLRWSLLVSCISESRWHTFHHGVIFASLVFICFLVFDFWTKYPTLKADFHRIFNLFCCCEHKLKRILMCSRYCDWIWRIAQNAHRI